LPKPKTLASGAVIARQVIPADIRDDYKRLYGVAWEERWHAPPGAPIAERKRLYGEWIAEITGRIEALRAAKRGDGIDLSHKDAVALAGEWYNWFVARYEDNPGESAHWALGVDLLIDDMLCYAPEEVREQGMSAHPGWERDPEVRVGMRPVIADHGETTQFLANRGIALTNGARTLFLDCVLDKLIAAYSLLERRAEGDYAPDELPKQFPQFLRPTRQNADAQSPWKLFQRWEKARLSSPING
jgi:hypothetical protein